METRDWPEPGLCFNRSMRRSALKVNRLYDEALAPTGLRAFEFAILVELGRSSMSLAELADFFLLDRAAFRYRLGSLERGGLMALVSDPRDKRARRPVLTEKGIATVHQAAELWRGAQQRFKSAIGPDQAAALKATVDVIASAKFVDVFRA